jgi:1-acyl-sn-glycerol-3-phosphate acyltransferase
MSPADPTETPDLHDADASAVPDAAVPPRPSERITDVVLGGEATVPAGEYGPPIHSRFPDPARRRLEVSDLERRLRERLTPLLPAPVRPPAALGGLIRIYRELAMRRRPPVDEFGRDPVAQGRARRILEPLYRRYFRVEVDAIERVPDRGPVILVANHGGVLPFDLLMLMEALRLEHPSRRDLRPLVEDAMFHLPFLGVALSRVGAVRACPENADRLLGAGAAVAVFPEGHKGPSKLYGERYQLKRFGRGGFVKLAVRNRAPLVPVAIVGAEESMPLVGKAVRGARAFGLPLFPLTPTFPLLGPLGLLPLPSRWRIHFGEPIDPPRAAGHKAVKEVSAQVRSEVEALLAAALESRGNPWLG